MMLELEGTKWINLSRNRRRPSILYFFNATRCWGTRIPPHNSSGMDPRHRRYSGCNTDYMQVTVMKKRYL
jgi:hypothetical protein